MSQHTFTDSDNLPALAFGMKAGLNGNFNELYTSKALADTALQPKTTTAPAVVAGALLVAGADTIDLAAANTQLNALRTEVNALRTLIIAGGLAT